jgi:hypothetical protein
MESSSSVLACMERILFDLSDLMRWRLTNCHDMIFNTIPKFKDDSSMRRPSGDTNPIQMMAEFVQV